MIEIVAASKEEDIVGIIALQKQNLPIHLSPEQMQSQGFVTVVHSVELLTRMNEAEPSIIAKDGNKVVGYCLAMTQDFENAIPVLVPMFKIMNGLVYGGEKLGEYAYIVVGQVCIGENYRGIGLLDRLYEGYKNQFERKYSFALTEIALRNTRSLAAHRRIGFETIHTYVAPDGESWAIVLWDWRK